MLPIIRNEKKKTDLQLSKYLWKPTLFIANISKYHFWDTLLRISLRFKTTNDLLNDTWSSKYPKNPKNKDLWNNGFGTNAVPRIGRRSPTLIWKYRWFIQLVSTLGYVEIYARDVFQRLESYSRLLGEFGCEPRQWYGHECILQQECGKWHTTISIGT